MSNPFKLRSGNRTPFKQLGSSPVKQSTEEIWNQKTNTGTEGIPEDGGVGMEFLKNDLRSDGYKKRLENELAAAGESDYVKRAPNEGELEIRPDRSLVKVKNPSSEDVMDIRTNRSENIMFNDPSAVDKEGNRTGYANADYIMKTPEGNRLMPSTNVNFSNRYDWKGGQKDRIEGGDLITHEGAHAITAGEHGMLENTKNLLTSAKGGGSGNINQPQEVYARYKVAQKYLKDKGIFDAFTGDEFTDAHVNQINKLMEGVNQENFQTKNIPYEVFTFFGDDKEMKGHGFNKKMNKKDMKNIFNNVASNEPDPSQITDDFGNQQTFA